MDNVLPNLGAEGFHLWLFSRFSRESNKGILCSNHPSEQGTKPGLARREKNSGATQGNTSMKNPGFQRALGTSCWLGIHPFSQESRAGWSLRVGIAPWPPKSQIPMLPPRLNPCPPTAQEQLQAKIPKWEFWVGFPGRSSLLSRNSRKNKEKKQTEKEESRLKVKSSIGGRGIG